MIKNKIKKIFLRKSKFYWLVFIFVIAFAGTAYALNIWNTGYRINTETKNVYVGAGQDCHKITNTSGNSYFIPTKTTAEWNSFASHLPSGASVASCGPPATFTECHITARTNTNYLYSLSLGQMDNFCKSSLGDDYWFRDTRPGPSLVSMVDDGNGNLVCGGVLVEEGCAQAELMSGGFYRTYYFVVVMNEIFNPPDPSQLYMAYGKAVSCHGTPEYSIPTPYCNYSMGALCCR